MSVPLQLLGLRVRGASPLAGEASSREAATSTVVLEGKEER